MREFMRQQGCDALAFTSPDWFEWASNHPIRELAWERPFLLVVTSDGQAFAIIAEQSRNQVAEEKRRGAIWIDEVAFYLESPSRELDEPTAERWPELAADLLKANGLGGARIAADAISEPLARAAQLAPEIDLMSAPRESLRALRWVKHEEELAIMRAAAALSDWGLNAYREELRPGRLLAEIDFAVCARLVAEAARRHPGEDFSIASLSTLSGLAAACPKGDGAPNGKVLENNAVAVSTLATRLNGLAMEIARTWVVGAPGERAIACYDCALDAQTAAIEAAVAGKPVRGVHEAARTVVEKAGLGRHLRLRAGHGIGVAMHDFPEDMPFNARPLLAGETYAIEPGLYIDGLGGFRFADVVVVGEGRAEVLASAPKERASQTLALSEV